jgi:uncharacterized protein with NAD-binding domain and iron-sulfur cluster
VSANKISTPSKTCIVVGAGLSGLAACLELERQGHSCLLLEETSQIGGKIKTEVFEGRYLLDHGFQVILPAYSELKRLIDLKELDLKYFNAGAMIRIGDDWTKISDPLRDPSLFFETAFSKVGSLKDKLLILKLRLSVLALTEEQLFKKPMGSSLDFLRAFGFSEAMIANFWSPFFSGIFLEPELKTEASLLRFLFKMFSQSPVAVPAKGMGHLAALLFSKLRNTELRLNTRVQRVEKNRVELADGTFIEGQTVDTRPTPTENWGSVTTLYFAAKKSPVNGPWLILNSKQNKTLINHVAVLSEVSKNYSPDGEALISVNLIQPKMSDSDFKQVKKELKDLFGAQTETWRFLKAFEIEKALPLYLSLPMGIESLHTPSQQGSLLRGKNLIGSTSNHDK